MSFSSSLTAGSSTGRGSGDPLESATNLRRAVCKPSPLSGREFWRSFALSFLRIRDLRASRLREVPFLKISAGGGLGMMFARMVVVYGRGMRVLLGGLKDSTIGMLYGSDKEALVGR